MQSIPCGVSAVSRSSTCAQRGGIRSMTEGVFQGRFAAIANHG
jgi:hypothetical protein